MIRPATAAVFLTLLFIGQVVAAPRATRGKTEKKPAIDLFAEAKGKIFRWQFKEGDILELKKFSEQTIKAGTQSVQRSVFHRVLLETKNADTTKGYQLEGTFMSLIRGGESKSPYTETERFSSAFIMKPIGQFVVSPDQYMPNIRSVPTFSDARDPALKDDQGMEAGSTWERPGEEVMKFTNLVTVPFNVRYEYRGLENVKSEEGEKSCHKIISNYELNYGDGEAAGPRVFGYVTAVWFWDAQQGIPYYAQEEYNVIIVNEQGIANEFKIKSRSYYRKFRARADNDKINLAAKLKEDLQADNPEVSVRVTDQGVAISLPEIFFSTGSAKLSKESRAALEKIAGLLKKGDARPIRVRGHTDNVGDEAYNQQLSEQRASRVAEYLIENAELNPDKMSYDGRGARDPVADNATSEGRAKNRRVEIILLDK